MNILNWLRPKTQQAPARSAPAPAGPEKHIYDVKDWKVSIRQAETLEAFYAADQYINSAQEVLKGDRDAGKLRSQDGTAADFDAREGHVVLLQQRSEFHPTETGYEARLNNRRKVTVDGHLVTVRGYDHTNGVWDRQAKTVTLEVPGSKYGPPVLARDQESEETFLIDAQGRIALPGAGSLSEAEAVAPRRRQAKRAQEMIQSAMLWHEAAKGQDGKAGDLNPAPDEVVAADVSRTRLAKTLAGESVMGGAHTLSDDWDSSERTFAGFDLQASATEFIVAGASPGEGDSNTKFLGTFTDQSVDLAYQNAAGNQEERVTWSKADGTVTYQTNTIFFEGGG